MQLQTGIPEEEGLDWLHQCELWVGSTQGEQDPRVWEGPGGMAPVLPQPWKSVCTGLPGQRESRTPIYAPQVFITI